MLAAMVADIATAITFVFISFFFIKASLMKIFIIKLVFSNL